MAVSDADSFEGASKTATLDTVAQTLTFEHRGWGATREQKALSPLVVPLGALSAVEFEKHWFNGYLQIVRRGQQPWLHSIHSDPHALTCAQDPTGVCAAGCVRPWRGTLPGQRVRQQQVTPGVVG